MSEPKHGSGRPRSRINGALLALFFASLAAMALFVLAYQRRTMRPRSYSDSGLNLAGVAPPADAPQAAASVPAPVPAPPEDAEQAAAFNPPMDSGLSMIRGATGIRSGMKSGAGRKETAAWTITRLIRINEARYQRIAEAYSKKYPLLRQYGTDWMRYPDLRRYNNEYFQDHDPIKFAWNVARSKNFAALVKKYSGQEALMAVITEFARQTPAELADSGRAYLEADNNAAALVKQFATAAGLPGDVFSGLAGGKISPGHAAASAISRNPELQRYLQQSNIDPNTINAGFSR